jgi:hypothetical protein
VLLVLRIRRVHHGAGGAETTTWQEHLIGRPITDYGVSEVLVVRIQVQEATRQ